MPRTMGESQASKASRPSMVRGGGLGYRASIEADIRVHAGTGIDWLELIADQFLPLTGRRKDKLTEISELLPCVTHSLDLSVGGWAPVDLEYLAGVVSSLMQSGRRGSPITCASPETAR
jgi:uncharacterized protein (UPF0276 family)